MQNDWELKFEKVKLPLVLTVLVVVVIVSFGFMSYKYKQKYNESTVTELFEIAVSNYSNESYSTGTIKYVSEEITENKKTSLSIDNMSDLLTQLEKTTVTGIKRKDIDALDLHNSYIVEIESDYADDIVFFTGRDENTQNIILEIFASNKKLADKYLVQDEGFFNIIEKLIKQSP